MTTISFIRHQFPPDIIRHAVWLYLRFSLSFRDVEDLLAERGLDLSYETVGRWALKFGPLFAKELRSLIKGYFWRCAGRGCGSCLRPFARTIGSAGLDVVR